MGNNHINSAFYIISDNYCNDIFISVVKINFIPFFQFTFFINIDKTIFFKFLFCQIHKFSLCFGRIQIFFIIFSKVKNHFFLFICIIFPQIFLCHFLHPFQSSQNTQQKMATWKKYPKSATFFPSKINFPVYLNYLTSFNFFSNSFPASSYPGFPNNANIFFLYASTPGWSNGFTPKRYPLTPHAFSKK